MPELLKIPELADQLRVSVAVIRRWIENGTIPASFVMRAGPKTIRIRSDVVAHFLGANPTPPAA